MRTILWFIYFGLYLIFVYPPCVIIGRTIKKQGRNPETDKKVEHYVQNWANRLLWAAGAKIRVEGKENIPEGTPALFVANHQGNFDIPIILTQLGSLKAIVAKKEMKSIPGIRTWMTYFDCLFMDRDDPRQSLKCLNQAQELLENGKSVVIFPEGTRSKGSEMGEFKPGALRCALKSGAPIVPVAISGSFRLMEGQGFWIRPAHVKLTILPPVLTKDIEKERSKVISDEIQAMIAAVLEGNKNEAKA